MPIRATGARVDATRGGWVYPEHDDQAVRKQIHVKVCPASWHGWDRFARKQGVTLAALIDAIGHQLGDAEIDGVEVEGAREIDANRRRRAV